MFRNLKLFLVCPLAIAIFILLPVTFAFSSCGNSNGDEVVDVVDIVYLMNYCYKNGPPPPYPDTAEVDGYEFLNIRDAVCLVNYVFYDLFTPTCPATNPNISPG